MSSEETHTVKQAFLMFGDAMRALNATQQVTNRLLVEVVDQLKSIDRRDQEIAQRMNSMSEIARDTERRVGDSSSRIKVLERRLDAHETQLTSLRRHAIGGATPDAGGTDRTSG